MNSSNLQQVERKENLTAEQLQLLKKVFEVISPMVDNEGKLNVVHIRRMLILARINPDIGQVCSIHSYKLINHSTQVYHGWLYFTGGETTCTSQSKGHWKNYDRIGWPIALHLAISPSITWLWMQNISQLSAWSISMVAF